MPLVCARSNAHTRGSWRSKLPVQTIPRSLAFGSLRTRPRSLTDYLYQTPSLTLDTRPEPGTVSLLIPDVRLPVAFRTSDHGF